MTAEQSRDRISSSGDHTPGPWFADVGMNVIGIGPEADVVDEVIADVPFSGETPSERDWANARLIAAAPRLLAALCALDAVFDFSVPGGTALPLSFEKWDALNTAFTKARSAITAATMAEDSAAPPLSMRAGGG